MDIGQRIRARREELNMTQDELAKKLGYKSRSSVNKIETSREVSMKMIGMYAKALDTDVPYLMGWKDNFSIIETANKDLALSNMSERIKDYALILNDMPSDQQEHIISLIDMLNKNNK